jgi:hypothetical protein
VVDLVKRLGQGSSLRPTAALVGLREVFLSVLFEGMLEVWMHVK